MMRKTRRIKNFVLKTVTLLSMPMSFVFAVMVVDTGEIKYKILLAFSMLWLVLFALANGGVEIIKESLKKELC